MNSREGITCLPSLLGGVEANFQLIILCAKVIPVRPEVPFTIPPPRRLPKFSKQPKVALPSTCNSSATPLILGSQQIREAN